MNPVLEVRGLAKTFGGIHVLVNAAAMRDPTATVTELDSRLGTRFLR